jgi:two-component system chemotaxis response regulator CheY
MVRVPEPRKLMRILIVDDDTRVREALRRDLERLGHEVYDFARALPVLARLAELPPFDAILTDVDMPEMDGVAFALAVRERYPDLAIPIGFVTGGSRSLDRLVGAPEVLQKPWTLETLSATLERLARSRLT